MKNQAYFDILFDSNDIFADRILESIYVDYLKQYLLKYIQQQYKFVLPMKKSPSKTFIILKISIQAI